MKKKVYYTSRSNSRFYSANQQSNRTHNVNSLLRQRESMLLAIKSYSLSPRARYSSSPSFRAICCTEPPRGLLYQHRRVESHMLLRIYACIWLEKALRARREFIVFEWRVYTKPLFGSNGSRRERNCTAVESRLGLIFYRR